MEQKLKPCPLCDCLAITVDDHTEYIGTPIPYKQVICEGCGCQTAVSINAVNEWNTRADINQRLVEALEEIKETITAIPLTHHGGTCGLINKATGKALCDIAATALAPAKKGESK